MTFFYDLNKRMADLSQKQTLSEGAVAERATGDYSAKKAAAGKDIGKPGKNFEKIAKDAGQRYGSKAAGERVAGAVLNKLRNPKEDMDESALQGYLGKKKYGDEGMKALQKAGRDHASAKTMSNIRNKYDKYDESQGMTDEGNAFAKAVVDAKRDGIQPGEKIRVGGKDIPLKEKLSPARQKSFAALAPPRDKITFADKIAGAKKEVDEMLGDVAAEAMKSAVKTMHGTADMAEDFDDMQRDVKKRMGPKVGDVRRGARHDIETTATGIRATRRHDDETDDQPTGEKRRAGRPKGADKGPERVTGKAYKHKGGRKTNEGDIDITDRGEYDQEGDMAKDSIKTVVRHAQALEKILGDNDNLPEWVQSKLAKIESMMTAVDDYMQNQEDDQGDDMPMGEESTNKRDNRAEKAGKRVTKDIESDEKKKEKKVAETTTSGSVATGGDAPKASKGGMQVGKGIYDSLNRKVEGMIAESMSINVSMSTDDNGSHKNITVTAADEDAEALAQLLRSAGLGGGMQHDHGHAEPCPDCGCDQGMAEAYGDTDASQNEPNWPTNTEYTSMKQSTDPDGNDLNRNKTDVAGDGQTTIPVTAVHTQDEDALRRMMEMAGIKQQELKPWERTMKEDTIEEDELDEGWKEKMAAAALAGSMALGAGGAHAGTSGNQDAGSNTPQQAAGQTVGSMAQAQRINYQLRSMINTVKDLKQQNRLDPGFEKDYNQMQTVSNTGSPDSKVAGDFANAKMLKQLFQKYNMTLPYVQEDVAEGVVDTVKDVVKKGLEKLGHGSDEDMRKDLQKKMDVPPTGEKPADKKMEESLMQEFANFKI